MDKGKQMEFLFEEGGIADDGMDLDPVSGNEVPSGSLAKEVRDDIPAQLSEGEYVVPADVVRYYGVKYFEDLREEAKEGLGEMEEDGRIGGEPVDMEDSDDNDLSPEEQAELEAIMGMAVGGYVDQSNGSTNVSGVSTYNPLAQQALYNQPRGFAEGGYAGTQVYPDFSQFRAGFSFMGPQPGTGSLPTVSTMRSVTLYGPDGEVVNLSLPVDQARYDTLIQQGYSESPVSGFQQTQVQDVAQQQQQTGGDDSIDPFQAQRDLQRTLDTEGGTFTTDEIGRVQADPISFGIDALRSLEEDGLSSRQSRAITGGASILAGPVFGLAAGVGLAGSQLDKIAQARAARNIAAERGLDTTQLDELIDGALENASLGVSALEKLGFGSGRRYTQEMRDLFAERDRRESFTAPSWMTDAGVASTAAQNANEKLRSLTGAAAGYANDQLERGYTGSSVNDIAVGNISGDGQIEGVVANEDGTVVRDENNRTVFRDEQGRTYVKTGILGTRREYKEVEDVPQATEPTPAQQPQRDTDGGGSQQQQDTTNVGNWGGDRDNDGVPNWRDFNDGVGARDKNQGGGGDTSGSGKIVCTAMNASYGFGSYRQAIWLRYSEKNLTEYHEKGYHKIFLPLVDRAYNRGDKNSKLLRKVLENIARHRTADLRAEMQGKKRDTVGRIYRAVLEPLCYIVGRFSKK